MKTSPYRWRVRKSLAERGRGDDHFTSDLRSGDAHIAGVPISLLRRSTTNNSALRRLYALLLASICSTWSSGVQ